MFGRQSKRLDETVNIDSEALDRALANPEFRKEYEARRVQLQAKLEDSFDGCMQFDPLHPPGDIFVGPNPGISKYNLIGKCVAYFRRLF